MCKKKLKGASFRADFLNDENKGCTKKRKKLKIAALNGNPFMAKLDFKKKMNIVFCYIFQSLLKVLTKLIE